MLFVEFFNSLVVTVVSLLTLCFLLALLTRLRRRKCRKTDEIVVGFFHPYCNAGGGGERVLWCAINAIQNKYPNAKCVVYTGDTDATGDEILSKAQSTFNIKVERFVNFQHLTTRCLVEAKLYPLLTLLGQSVGSIVLGLEAAFRYPPDIYIDTMGYAFTIPIFKLLCGCETACYVHYPTISSDMLNVVECRNNSFNNRKIIARSKLLTSFKLAYYKLFAYCYGVAGRQSNVVMVNSSWTQGHVDQLWSMSGKTWKIYPPCDVMGHMSLPLERPEKDEKLIVSIAQFRPEKDHALQIRSFHRFLSNLKPNQKSNFRLVLAGGCRNHGDEARVNELRQLSKELDLGGQVEIQTNISFSKLKELLASAHVGMHTMKNEHFGIGVVEFQAAGVIVLAHNSGGPEMDIVQKIEGKRSGYLADDEESYAQALHKIFIESTHEERVEMQKNARISCHRFSEEGFQQHFQQAVTSLFQ